MDTWVEGTSSRDAVLTHVDEGGKLRNLHKLQTGAVQVIIANICSSVLRNDVHIVAWFQA